MAIPQDFSNGVDGEAPIREPKPVEEVDLVIIGGKHSGWDLYQRTSRRYKPDLHILQMQD